MNIIVINFGLPVLVMKLHGFSFSVLWYIEENTAKEPSKFIQQLFKVFYMFKIIIFYDNDGVVDALGIECINYKKVVGY